MRIATSAQHDLYYAILLDMILLLSHIYTHEYIIYGNTMYDIKLCSVFCKYYSSHCVLSCSATYFLHESDISGTNSLFLKQKNIFLYQFMKLFVTLLVIIIIIFYYYCSFYLLFMNITVVLMNLKNLRKNK